MTDHPDKGPPFVSLEQEAADEAAQEFASEDDRVVWQRPDADNVRKRRPGRSGDEDDFEIAVDEEEFRGDTTARLEADRLAELLAVCESGDVSAAEGSDISASVSSGQAGAYPPITGTHPSTSLNLNASVHRPAVVTGPQWPAVQQKSSPLVAASGKAPDLIAIDFGTSYSSVAVSVDGRAHVLPVTPSGKQVLASLVGIDERGGAVIGEKARRMLVTEPANVIPSPKRLLGRQYDHTEVQPHLAQMAMTSSEGPDGDIRLQARGRSYTVSELCAPLLHHLRLVAREQIGKDVTDVVATVPVTFDQVQRRALSDAAAMAGLRIVQYLEEPTAAVLANRNALLSAGMVAVYDFGGGTFDFSVVEVDDKGKLSVVTNAGDTWLGGDDFDELLANAAANAFWRETKIELRRDAVRWQRLLLTCERAKRELSRRREATVHLEDAALVSEGTLDLTMTVTRQQFAELSQELIQRTLDTCETALELCDIKFSDLKGVYMSGGTSYIPAVMDSVAKAFGNTPLVAAPPDMAVVLGAANYTATLRDRERAEA